MQARALWRPLCGGATVGDYHKDTYTWAFFGGLMIWIFSGSLWWAFVLALLIGYYVEKDIQKKSQKDDDA